MPALPPAPFHNVSSIPSSALISTPTSNALPQLDHPFS